MDQYSNIRVVKQPENIKVGLFKHQLASIYNMEKLEREQRVKSYSKNDITIRETRLGINADEAGFGKCLAKGTKVILFSGERKSVEDIVTGDLLMGDDNEPRKVLSLARGKERMYTVYQYSGENYTVNASHILSLCMDKECALEETLRYYKVTFLDEVSGRPGNRKFIFVDDVDKRSKYKDARLFLEKLTLHVDMNVETYKKLPLSVQNIYKGYKVRLDFPPQSIHYKPYSIGKMIGKMIVGDEKIEKKAISLQYCKNGIPKNYLVNTKKVRRDLLMGILNSSCFGCNTKGVYTGVIRSTKMVDEILFLVRSIGFQGWSTHTKDFQCEISVDINRCKTLTSIFVKLKEEEGEYYGFTIDGNHRFLLHDCTVTHNTLSMVGLVGRDKMKWDLEMPYEIEHRNNEIDGIIRNRYINLYQRLPATLILLSNTIIYQWMDELAHTDLAVSMITTTFDIDHLSPQKCDIVLVTTGMYNRLTRRYRKFAWKRFIFDEPGHVRVSAMKEVIAGFYWFVTATPNSITDRHINCRSSFMRKFIPPPPHDLCEAYKGMIMKNDSSFVRESFHIFPIHEFHYSCYLPIYGTVHNFVNPLVKTMIEAGNIEGAIMMLGGQRTDNIVELIKKRKLEELEEIESKIRIYTSRQNTDQIDHWVSKRGRIRVQIAEIEQRFNQILLRDCTICFSNLTSPVLEPLCQNVFCGECLFKWLEEKGTCPLCRSRVDASKLVYINTEEPLAVMDMDIPDRPKTKIETLVSIFEKKPAGKFLLFSAYDNSFAPLQIVMMEHDISYTEIKGTALNKKRCIQGFKDGDTQVVFINSKTNVAGINLQEATDIILYHDMDAETEKQIIGRVDRIGRTHDISIHYLHIFQ